MDGYECNLLVDFVAGAETKLFLFLASLLGESRERREGASGFGLATQERAAAGNKTAAQRS